MTIHREPDSPDVAEILNTIRRMAAEKRVNGFRNQPTIHREVASELPVRVVIKSPSSLRDRLSEAAITHAAPQIAPPRKSMQHDLPVVPDATDVPRTMRPMTDTRMARFSKLAAIVWPGINTDVPTQSCFAGQSKTSGSCFGPLLSAGPMSLGPLQQFQARSRGQQIEALHPPGSGTLPVFNATDRRDSGPTQISDVPGGIPGLPELARSKTNPRPQSPQQSRDHSVEDASARLLQPLIRNWVNENMPKIIENALNIENSATDA